MNLPKSIMILFVFIFISCEDIIEEELDKSPLTVYSPLNNYTTTNNRLIFWWEEREESDGYEIQIVEGTFSSPSRFVFDTLITDSRIEFTFMPAEYEWRVRAVNSISASEYSTYRFRVDTTSDLTSKSINIIHPNNDKLFGKEQFTFRWDALFGAENYLLKVWKGNRNTGNLIIEDTLTTTEKLSPFFLDGQYEWGIIGYNSKSESLLSTDFFSVDTINPSPPLLVSPINGQNNVSQKFTLSWDAGSDSHPSTDSLFVYQDLNRQIVLRKLEIPSNSLSLQYSDSLDQGTYYWRVKSLDAVGNQSAFSTFWNFTIQ